MPAVARSTVILETTPRIAHLGSTNYTNIDAGITASIDASVGDKHAFVIARWVDDSNYAYAKVHMSAESDTTWVGIVLAGVDIPLGDMTSSITVAAQYPIRLVVLASGRAIAVLYGPGGAVLAMVEATHIDLATGGTLATGKPGFADQSTGTQVATRTYDRFYASTPPAEPLVINSGRSIQIRHDGCERESSDGLTFGTLSPRGGRVFVPCAGVEDRSTRLWVKAKRNDVSSTADANVADSTKVGVTLRPRYRMPSSP
jgi:hypothetical protein